MIKWFFALNEMSLSKARGLWEPMILAAVQSAAVRSPNLKPHLVFDGGDDPFLSTLESKGVAIVRHRVSFYDQLASHAADNPAYLSTASGAFLRTEIPLLEHEETFVLYTDCDVMFERGVELEALQPRYFACAPEFDKDNFTAFNTGVMMMNVVALRADLSSFTRYIRENLTKFETYDQDAYRLYYAGRADPLPVELNWKPYWGPSDQAQIVHFHGPKPGWARHLLAHPDDMKVPALNTIFNWNVAGYERYVPEWEKLVNAARPPG